MNYKTLPVILLMGAMLAGCGVDDGDDGKDGVDGESFIIGVLPASSADSLDVTIDEVGMNEVHFTALDGGGTPVTGLRIGRGGNLRFTISTLIPGTNGSPSYWYSYIEAANGQATYERDGTLEDLGNGHYVYKTEVDITADPQFNPSRTHRVAMQIDGFPATNPFLDFRPDGGVVTGSRNLVTTEGCNSCHNKLALHGGGRIEIEYCTQCHTPQTVDPDTGNTVDFKVMIHKLHRGEELPSVIAGTPYQIIGFGGNVHDFSTVVFPQDIRNCTKCHNDSLPGAPNPLPGGTGGYWTRASLEACGSCHDDIDFNGDTLDTNDDHAGGFYDDDSLCQVCHRSAGFAGSVEESHEIPEQEEATKFEFNIHDVTGGDTPVIEISVSDPTNGDAPYDLATDPFTGGGARLAVIIGWGMTDFNNTGGATSSGFPNFQDTAALPLSIDPVAACGAGIADWTCLPDTPDPGTYQLTKASALPGTATGTGRVGFEGHVAADFDGDLSFDDEVAVKSVVKDFLITGSSLASRREVVDIDKCNNCHEQVSLHGGNRNDEPALCVICHNPNATDIGRRPADPADSTDGKVEEAIDFKRLIHGVHAGAKTNYDGSEGHGFREKGLVVWGFPGAPCNFFGGPPNNGCEHDFSHVRFPGILQDCETCHKPGTYELDGDWASPTANGILSTTTSTLVNTVPTDDLNISPIAAVCSSCHDDDVAQAHMINLGGAVFDQTQAVIDGGVIETCSVCHGPGHLADVEVVHGID